MAFRELKEQHFTDADLSVMMSQLKEWAAQFKDIPFLDGRLLEDISVSTTATKFNHGLNREPRGWFVVKANANVNVWQTSQSKLFITLDASGSATVSIWIF